MSKKGPLRAAIERATKLYQDGAADEYLTVVREARKHAPPDGRGLSADETAALAEGWEAEGFDELYKGRLQQGLQCLVTAEKLLAGWPELNELRGRICHTIGSQISGHTSELQAAKKTYADLARALLADSEDYRELLETIPVESQADQSPWQVRRRRLLEEARPLQEKLDKNLSAMRSREVDRLFDLRLQALYIGIEDGDDEAAADGFIDAADLALTFCSGDSGPFFAVTQVFRYLLTRSSVRLGKPLRQVAETAMRLAIDSQSADQLSEAYLLAALSDRDRRDMESCLQNSLASIWHGQRYQAQDSPSVLMRDATRERLDDKRALAIEASLELGHPEIVAELIEGARLQALAETAQTLLSDIDEEHDFATLLSVTGVPLKEVHPVSVGGRSRVPEAGGGSAGPVVLSLEAAITSVGGSRAVFWSSWLAFKKYYWAIQSPDGTWSAGCKDLSSHADAIVAAVQKFRDGLPDSATLDQRDQELLLMRDLGTMVIPLPLAELLEFTSTRVSPVSLVVTGAFVCQLPLPALVIPGTADERLIERTVIRIQPPTVFMKEINSRPGGNSDDGLIVRLACLDPSGDLPYSRNYEIPAEKLITAPTKIEWAKGVPEWREPARSRLATRSKLIEFLRQGTSGEPGVFVYSGHVQQRGVADGPETSLLLADGPMSAAELSRLPIPSHVLLSACSSSGAVGAGAGEWLGLGGSLLRGGARQVIATSWPILDSAFTARFELGILERMCADGDPAAALRQSQLDALSEWRSHTWRPSETVNAALPWIWAAFQVIG